MERQNRQEQSADDPSVDLIRVNMLNSTISMDYLMLYCMYRT